MINGIHILIYSRKAAADKKFFKEVLKCPSVDVGGGWLIFGLPPSELAFHPSPEDISTELYLMCDNIHLFIEEMKKHNVECGRIGSQAWGFHTHIILPSGGKLGVYQPTHERPKPMKVKSTSAKVAIEKKAAPKSGKNK
ncbi:MAG TPA: hypothetical protein PK511_13870 [Chitinophagales bacterium]|nr:hypothetical protein [Chitinophagales bacterium]HNF70365.1 hypothetical protein [Chitinophagales bacterium]HNI55609.1 hypothetical protein [Chitinophagales bacterium]HNO28572.1 hypothetical protein [Chitinophagales bacterium]